MPLPHVASMLSEPYFRLLQLKDLWYEPRAATMKSRAELAHIRLLCSLGLGGAAIMPALLKSLHQLVPCDSAGFFWVDRDGDMADMYVERMLPPELTQRYFERHYDSAAHAFRERLLARMARREYIGEVVVDSRLEETPYFQEILRPLGVQQILIAVVHDEDVPLGQLSLYRGAYAPRFTGDDRDALATASRYMAPALCTPIATQPDERDQSFRDSDEEAVVVFDAAGTISSASHRAHALLAHASGEAVNRNTMRGAIARGVRKLLVGLAEQLQLNAPEQSVASVVVSNVWGRFRLRAYTLEGGQYAALVQRQEHFLVRLADAMRAVSLSPQQRETALLLARGMSNNEIAAAMSVSVNTANYHVKQLFQKLDAHDRGEVLVRIMDAGAAHRA